DHARRVSTTQRHVCQSWLRRRRALATVRVLEPHDVVNLWRRDLEDRRVVERRHAVDRAGTEAERRACGDHLLLQRLLARRTELELCAARLHEPRLVLFPMELQRERLTCTHEQHLAAVAVG